MRLGSCLGRFLILGSNIQTSEAVAERVRKHLGPVHLVDALDGSLNKYFTCFRCKRRMPDSAFACIGTRAVNRRAVTVLHSNCHTCRKQVKGRWVEHPKYTAELDRYWSARIPKVRAGAESRSIFFGIDADDLLGKHLEQDGRCALSGFEFDLLGTSRKLKSGKNLLAPSVDRIDSSKHYTLDNIQLVLLQVNIMKGELPQDVFVEFCQQIVSHKMLA